MKLSVALIKPVSDGKRYPEQHIEILFGLWCLIGGAQMATKTTYPPE
jgi:hypothetical protein